MKKLLIYIALFLILIALKQSGLIYISWDSIGIAIGIFCFICVALFMYGYIKAGRDIRKTRKFWETYQKDYDEIHNEQEEL